MWPLVALQVMNPSCGWNMDPDISPIFNVLAVLISHLHSPRPELTAQSYDPANMQKSFHETLGS